MKSVSSVWELVLALGGPTAAGDFFGVKASQIHIWRNANRIAPEYYLAKRRLARRGIRVEPELFGVYKRGRLHRAEG